MDGQELQQRTMRYFSILVAPWGWYQQNRIGRVERYLWLALRKGEFHNLACKVGI